MIVTFLPYQCLLSISSLRGVYRELRKQNNWEKTDHVGAHRAPGSGVVENAQIATVPLVQSR